MWCQETVQTAWSSGGPWLCPTHANGLAALYAPAPEAPRQMLYVISDGQYVKIGVAADPEARRKQLSSSGDKTLAPADVDRKNLTLLHAASDAVAMERVVHSALAEHQAVGEWFHATDPVVAFLSRLPRYYDAPLPDAPAVRIDL